MSPNENSSSNSNAYYVYTDGTINNGNNNNNVTNSYGFRPCVDSVRYRSSKPVARPNAAIASKETLSYSASYRCLGN
ncbi:MAG: hypothetical protein NC311_06335 [Muribaculaceae bacterium]|nr:hypothetical protein [Muribaculaceae bacterium]